MIGRAATVALRRHELARVIAADANRYHAWRMLTSSRYAAHAVYDLGNFYVGHVVGTCDAWWWGIQAGPMKTPTAYRAPDLMSAFRAAKQEALRLNRLRRARLRWAAAKAAQEEGGRNLPAPLAPVERVSDT